MDPVSNLKQHSSDLLLHRFGIDLTWNLLPVDIDFSDRNVQFLGDVEQLDVECPRRRMFNGPDRFCLPSFDMHLREDLSGTFTRE